MACSVFASTFRSLAAEPPIALHPENPHYFLWHGEPTLLITSGEHYGAVLNLDFDYVRYFDELQRNKLNHTRTFSGVYRETSAAFGITENTLAPLAERYVCPWARSDVPGYAEGGNKFDVSKWDQAYFDRLRDFLAQAQKRGIVVEMNLFCPMYEDAMWNACPLNPVNNVNGLPACPREEVFTLKHPPLLEVQLAVTRKIVQELREFDNLYYEICNEPYFGGVTMEWQHRIVDEIVAVEKDFEHRHLISLNIANGRQQVENPHPAVSIFNFHYCVPPDTVAMNYGLNKVIGENETGFRGKDDALYRTEGWDFLIAGGSVVQQPGLFLHRQASRRVIPGIPVTRRWQPGPAGPAEDSAGFPVRIRLRGHEAGQFGDRQCAARTGGAGAGRAREGLCRLRPRPPA